MKKTFISILGVIGCALMTSCGLGTAGTALAQQQPTASVATQQVSTGSNILSNIISTFASGLLTNQATITGTWNYEQPCVQFESENLLAKAGGTVAAASVQNKLATLYQMVGIKKGACTFTFNNDNTCTYTIAGRTSHGTYTFDATNKTITITTALGLKVTAYVSVSIGKMGLTFDATKLLSLVTAVSGNVSSLGGLSSIIGNYNGMKVGFEFSK